MKRFYDLSLSYYDNDPDLKDSDGYPEQSEYWFELKDFSKNDCDKIYDAAIEDYIKDYPEKTEEDFLIELKKEVESKQYYDDVIMYLLLAAENLGFLVLNEYEL